MSFGKCIQFGNHCHNQYMEHFQHLKILSSLSQSISQSQALATTDLLSVVGVAFSGFVHGALTQGQLSCAWLFSLGTKLF